MNILKCKQCSRLYGDPRSLENHVARDHADRPISPSEDALLKEDFAQRLQDMASSALARSPDSEKERGDG